tara:strand:- start:337 stop:492 length:156 start_codon:yes stop_codon:yes gene_type:complete
MTEILDVVSSMTPILIGIITLIIVLARMHYNLETLTEKVKILFDFHNKKKK